MEENERKIYELENEKRNAEQYEKRIKELEKEKEAKGKFEIKEKQDIERKIKEIKEYQAKLYQRIQERYRENIRSSKEIEIIIAREKIARENEQRQNDEWIKKNQDIRRMEEERARQQEQERLRRIKEQQEQREKEQEEEKEQEDREKTKQEQAKETEEEREKESGTSEKNKNPYEPYSEDEEINRRIALNAMYAEERNSNIRSQQQQYERGGR